MQDQNAAGLLSGLEAYEPLRFQNSTFSPSPFFNMSIVNSSMWCFPEDVLASVVDTWTDGMRTSSEGRGFIAWLTPVVVLSAGTNPEAPYRYSTNSYFQDCFRGLD